jgi:hypothetical protein
MISVIFTLLAITCVSAQIYVSKSANRDNPSLISNVTCLSRGNYVFLDLNETKNPEIERVTWHIKDLNMPLVKNKVYQDYFWPYDYHNGSTCNANVWDTTDSIDGEYYIYANIYKNNSIAEKYRENILICNDYILLSSVYQNITNPSIVTADTLVNFQESFLTVMPCDDIECVTFSFDNTTLSNSVFSTASNFVTNINNISFTDNKTHILKATILTVQNKTFVLSVVTPPVLPIVSTFYPTNFNTISPTMTPTSTPTSMQNSMPTSMPTPAPTSMPTSMPTSAPTSMPTSLPTLVPITMPTSAPTLVPTSMPTSAPTSMPTSMPTSAPTSMPTSMPTSAPAPTSMPTSAPTTMPTSAPTLVSIRTPTVNPTNKTTANLTQIYTTNPTIIPTNLPRI